MHFLKIKTYSGGGTERLIQQNKKKTKYLNN